MIFFYVGLGYAMMTSILSIFQIATTINKNQYTTRNNSVNSNKLFFQKENDKKFIEMLNDMKGIPLGSGELICENLKNGFTDELDDNYSILSNYSILDSYNTGIPSYSTQPRLINGCNLVNGYHRVVIVPSSMETNTYNLYSCIVKVEPQCPFELVD